MQLRNYPKSWKIVKLENVLDRISNGIVKSQNKESHGTPVTRIETIKDEFIDPSRVGYLENVSDEEIRRFSLILGDILFSHINSESHIGKTAIYHGNPRPLLHGMNLLLLRANKSICDPFYLNYILKFFRSKNVFIGLAARAVGQSSINQGKMNSLEIPLPPLPEQRAIARALRAVQGAWEARLRELALERERKAALMEQLFTHGTRGEPTKKTEIGEMPESWEAAKLGELCTFTTGKLNSEMAVDNGRYPFFTCSKETFSIDSYSFDQEAILLAGNNAQGIYSVKYYKGKFDAYQRTYVITIKSKDRFNYYYLHYDLSRKLDLLRKQSLGATTRFLTASIIKNLDMSVPSVEEQQIITGILRCCDARISALENEARLHDELFRAMLEELMSGRLSSRGIMESA